MPLPATQRKPKFRIGLKTSSIGLTYLDEDIGKSKNLRKIVPIKLIAVGGFVAVTYFQNRAITEDLDYMIDPTIENRPKIEQKLARAITNVGREKGYDRNWVNDRVTMFAVGDTAQSLFRDSVAQNIILWQGENLIVYAVKWEWSLARKVKRIGSTRREADISDAAALLRKMVEENGGPLQRERAKGWNQIVFTPIEDHAIDMVNGAYEDIYASHGFI
jgi:hypothetical protein